MGDETAFIPPHNRDAEEALLGSLMIDPSMILEISGIVKPEHFYRETNGFVYKAMIELDKKKTPIDFLTLTGALRDSNELEDVGGEVKIIGLLNTVPTSVNIHGYANIVVEKAIRRKMIHAGRAIAVSAYDESILLDEAITNSRTVLDVATTDGATQPTTIRDAASEMIDFVSEPDNKPDRIYTGFEELDLILKGIRSPQLIYLASRPGMGKTALLSSVAVNAARAGRRVMIFSLEMRPVDLVVRMAASQIKLNSQAIFDNDLHVMQRGDALKAFGELSELPITFAESWDASPSMFVSECRRVQAKYGLDLVLVDYLQLMRSDEQGANMNEKVSSISRNLKLAADSLDIPVLVASQLNRALEARKEKRPMLSDLRDSGSLEQDADVVMFIYRPGYYYKDEDQTLAHVIVAKHRNGPTGEITLRWLGEFTGFYDYVEQDYSTYLG